MPYTIGRTLGDGAIEILGPNGEWVAKTRYFLKDGMEIAKRIVDALNRQLNEG